VKTILIATRNRRKVGEIRAILGGQYQFLALNDFPNAPKVVEDADTFEGNATKKALTLAEWLARIQNPESRGRPLCWLMIRDLEWTRLAENPAFIRRVSPHWTKLKIQATPITTRSCFAC
jgi:hypothetical protein